MNVHTQNTCTYIVTLNKVTVVLHKIECIDRCNEIIYSRNKKKYKDIPWDEYAYTEYIYCYFE